VTPPTDAELAVFAAERPRLVGLAYRLLGSISDAEDVVQEAWFRWASTDRSAVERPAAWLTTVVSRLGLDRLRARQRERVDYVGPWLPEPIVSAIDDEPERAAVLSDSLTTAFLVVLEQLTPEERLVLLLVDVFGEPFRSVAALVERSEEACRQLAVRARRKVQRHEGSRPSATSAGAAEQLALATAFAGAVMSGDIGLVRSMLAPDVVLTSDGGARRHAARRPVVGADRVARFVVNVSRKVASASLTFDPVWVNGRPGAVVAVHGRPFMVNAVDIVDGRIVRSYWMLNPDKLASLGRSTQLL
jgi:RNA polymerase sigma-70 factor (ECF subfamily)